MENQNKEWTIMIYMAGDNNLSTDMSYALEQIKSVTAYTDKINLFVYYDGYSTNVPTLYCDFTERKTINYYRSFKVRDKLIKRGTPEFNENSASVNNIINFVDWCVNKVEHTVDGELVKGRKAERYAMIFSGHSLGFESKGLFKDEKSDSNMTLARLRWMFERITFKQDRLKEIAKAQQWSREDEWDEDKLAERTTEILGQELSILGFDSCVMSMLEIGCQFREVAETLIASEGSIPNAGWSYAPMLLGKIVDSRDKTSTEIAANFVEKFIHQQNKFALADISVDLSAWDLKKLGALETSFIALVKSFSDCFKDENSVAYRQMKRIFIQTHWQCQTFMLDQNIDLCDFCSLVSAEVDSLKNEFGGLSKTDFEKLLAPVIKVGENCKDVIEKLKECVIISGFSGSEYQYSNGISLFFPWSWESYEAARRSYEALTFVRFNEAGKKWNEFLFTYLDVISRRLPKPLSRIDDTGVFNKDLNHSVVYKSYKYSDEAESTSVNAANSKIPVNGSNKSASENNDNKIPVNGSNKSASENDDNKIPVNGSNKNPSQASLRIPVNGSNRIPVNGSNKIPVNGSNKMFNTLSLFFSDFMVTKNIRAFWNHSGFTSKTAQFFTEEPVEKPAEDNNAADASKPSEGMFVSSRPIEPILIVKIPTGSDIFVEDPDIISFKANDINLSSATKLLDLIKKNKETGDLNTLFNDKFMENSKKISPNDLFDSLIEKNNKFQE